MGRNILEVFPSFRNNPSYQQFRTVLRGETVYLPPVVDEETDEYFETYLIPIKNEDGDVSAVLWIVHDLSREYQLTKERTQTLNLLHATMDASQDMIQVFEAVRNEKREIIDFRYIILNHEAEKWMPDALGKTLLEIQPSVVEEGIFDAFKQVVETGISQQYEKHYVHGQFDGWFYQSVVKLNDGVATTTTNITERKKAGHEKLHLKDELYKKAASVQLQKITESTPALLTRVSRDLRYLFVNQATAQFLKLSQEEIIGKPILDVLGQQAFETIAPYIERVLNGECVEYETEITYATGKKLMHVIYIPSFDENNRTDGWYATMLDLTEQKKMQKALQQSEENYRSLFNSIEEGFAICDLVRNEKGEAIDCRFIDINPAFEKHLNLQRSNVIGRLRSEILPVDKAAIEMQAAVVFSNQPIRTEFYSTSVNQWYDLSIFPRGGDRFAVIFDNITKRKEAEQQRKDFKAELEQQVEERVAELTESKELLQTILDSTNRITVFDRQYRFMIWNKRCEEIHGVTRDKVIGKTIFEMFPGIENYPVFINAQERSLKGEYVHVPIAQDGYTGAYLELFYIPLKNELGDTCAVLNIMHDITRHIRNTEELGILNKKLASKNMELEQKNEEITSFAFVASHDMKEPLRKIHTFSDWLMKQEINQMSLKGKDLLEKINASVFRMEFLIDDILVLTKIHSDTHKEEEVNLNVILKNVIDDMGDKIEYTNTIIKSENLPTIKGNSNQLFYLFKNLISNAIKFQKPGSVPEVTIASEIVNGNELSPGKPGKEYLKLSFIDNGFGFDQRYAKKIFQVFQRLHGRHEFEGTGIGLAICKKIMENHSGVITVQSEQGKGSVFSCFFLLH